MTSSRTSPRYRPPFWRRGKPSAEHDISVLRPPQLPKGKRFETRKDARQESDRSEALLRAAGGGAERFANSLSQCGENTTHCDETFCPRCARTFRRWFTGELLRIATEAPGAVNMFTILLKEAGRGKIDSLDVAQYRHMLRKRLDRADLQSQPVIGGFEIVYKAAKKAWVLHINLVIIGGAKTALAKFKESFSGSQIERAVMSVPLRDRPEQLSYVLKFGTYHRPLQQSGSAKGPAKPLNASEHYELVDWMAQRDFKDFLFLYNARQGTDSIVLQADGS